MNVNVFLGIADVYKYSIGYLAGQSRWNNRHGEKAARHYGGRGYVFLAAVAANDCGMPWWPLPMWTSHKPSYAETACWYLQDISSTLCACVWSSQLSASTICQTSSTVCSKCSPQHDWKSCSFCHWTDSLRFTAGWFAGSSCWLRTFSAGLKTHPLTGHEALAY